MTRTTIQKFSCNRCMRSTERETPDRDWAPNGWRVMFLGEPNTGTAPAFVADLCPSCTRDAREFVAGSKVWRELLADVVSDDQERWLDDAGYERTEALDAARERLAIDEATYAAGLL